MSTRIIQVENQNFTVALPRQDLLAVLEFYKSSNLNLFGTKILITGATGFIGSLLVDALRMLNRDLNLNLEIYINSRNLGFYAQQIKNSKELEDIHLIEGDVSNVLLPKVDFSHVIHAATPTTHNLAPNETKKIEKASVEGLSNVLSQMNALKRVPRILNLSSGAAGFRQEIFESDVTSVRSKYARAKLASEQVLESGNSEKVIHGMNARLFAFFGPRLPVGDHYAIGNFMRDAWLGNEIRVEGSGESVRSYMHTSDLTSKLLYLLSDGSTGTFNIGSTSGYSIKYWAEMISNHFNVPMIIQGTCNSQESSYVSPPEFRIPVGPNENSPLIPLLESWYKWLDVNFKKSDFS